jgi:hypothetical protein
MMKDLEMMLKALIHRIESAFKRGPQILHEGSPSPVLPDIASSIFKDIPGFPRRVQNIYVSLLQTIKK